MQQPFNEIRILTLKNNLSYSFAKHFVSYFPKNSKLYIKNVREKVSMEILWKGNPISCTKTFGRLNCSLFMKERLDIINVLWDNAEKRLINSNNELYGACRHKPKFHRYINTTNSSADEGPSPERGDVTANYYPSPIESSRSNKYCTYIDTNNTGILNVVSEEGEGSTPSISNSTSRDFKYDRRIFRN